MWSCKLFPSSKAVDKVVATQVHTLKIYTSEGKNNFECRDDCCSKSKHEKVGYLEEIFTLIEVKLQIKFSFL